MKKYTLLATFLIFLLCACQKSPSNILPPNNQEVDSVPETYVTTDGVNITVGCINEQIKSIFNDLLFYGGFYSESNYIFSNEKLIVGKQVKYDLYFISNGSANADKSLSPSKMYLVITNFDHPLSTPEKPLLYIYGIDVTEYGLRTTFNYEGYITKTKADNLRIRSQTYLGSYSFCINRINPPSHDDLPYDWKCAAEAAIKLYMDENDFYAIEDLNLPNGKYTVYLQGFSRTDKDSKIVFVHENGSVYCGIYDSVHNISEDTPAKLKHVELYGWLQEETVHMYVERISQHPALAIEYTIQG